MKVTISSIDKTIFDGEATEVVLPGLNGKVGIKPNHAIMSVILASGDICVKLGNQIEKFTTTEGIAHISNNIISILLTD